DALGRAEEEELVLDDGAAGAAAELLAVEVGQGVAVGGVVGEGLDALVMEQAAVEVVGAGLGDDVDDTAAGAAKFRVRPAGDDLELLDGLKRDVDCGALAAGLLAEETVVVVAAVERD